jgi:hypothetical protein
VHLKRRSILPDGRCIQAVQESPTDDWVVQLVGADDESPVRHRWLLAAVNDLLGLRGGSKPSWVWETVEQLSGIDTPLGRRFPCPCCDKPVLKRPPTGTFQTCPVCLWEDDNIQCVDLDQGGGANKVSLREARSNFRQFGTSDPERLRRFEEAIAALPESGRSPIDGLGG